MNKEEVNIVYLGLGTNLGDKASNLRSSIQYIQEMCGTVDRESAIYQSEPWGYSSANNFYNLCLKMYSHLTPIELMDKINIIERKMGRDRTESGFSDRSIDIDILFYNDLILETDRLSIPHPRIAERKFVLLPMNEIASEFIHPGHRLSISELLKLCKDECDVNRID